jgi:hypothetical protein
MVAVLNLTEFAWMVSSCRVPWQDVTTGQTAFIAVSHVLFASLEGVEPSSIILEE